MNKITLSILLCLFINCANAQISIPGDSIKSVLCHKWGFKAILMGGQRLTNMNESVTYEFLTDGTFKRTSSGGKSENGKWEFKQDSKIVLLKIKKTSLHISALSNEELIVSIGDGSEGTNNLSMGTILKPIEEN